MRQPAVVVAGNLVMDLLVRPVDEIRWGGTRWVESILPSLGGNGANTAAALGKLGVDVALCGVAGADALGDAALLRLQECGVDTSAVRRLESTGTATTVALVRTDGARAFLHQPGASRDPVGPQVDFRRYRGARRFHLANPFAVLALRRHATELLRQARAAGLATSVDTGWDAFGEWLAVLEPCLPLTDLLFVNEEEARMLTGCADCERGAAQLQDKGASLVVLKLGARGCALFGAAPGPLAVSGFLVDAIDTTGAGDCFAGGFLAALERGLPLPEAARIANAVGALNVQSLGSTSGLRTWDETLLWAAARQEH